MTSHGSSSNVINKCVHVRVEVPLPGHLFLHLSPLVALLPLIQLVRAVGVDAVVAPLTFRDVRVPTSQLLMPTSAAM